MLLHVLFQPGPPDARGRAEAVPPVTKKGDDFTSPFPQKEMESLLVAAAALACDRRARLRRSLLNSLRVSRRSGSGRWSLLRRFAG